MENKRQETAIEEVEEVLEKKVTVSVGKILLVLGTCAVVFVLVLGAFLTGRYVFPASESLGGTLKAAGEALSSSVKAKVTLGTSATALSATANTTPSSNATGAQNRSTTTATTGMAAGAAGSTTASASSGTGADATAPASGAEDLSNVMTTGYRKVTLEFSRTPIHHWYGTWGKVETIYYRITNNEDSAILPANFVVRLEGYSDDEVPPRVRAVPALDQRVEPGEVAEHGFDVGASFNEAVTDPTTLEITVDMSDADGETIAIAKKEFNMKG